MLRPVALVLTVLATLAAPRAQAVYRADGDTGVGVGVGTSFTEGTSAVGALVFTVAPAFDLGLVAGRSSLGSRDATVLGATGTLYLEPVGPTRVGLSASVQRLSTGGQTATVTGGGVVVARQIDAGANALLVPSFGTDVVYVAAGRFDSGLQVVASAGLALVAGTSSDVRLYAGPSATLNVDTSDVAFSFSAGVVF